MFSPIISNCILQTAERLIVSDLVSVREEFERQHVNGLIRSHIERYANLDESRLARALLLLTAKVFGKETDKGVIQMAMVMEFLHIAATIHREISNAPGTQPEERAMPFDWRNNIAVLMGDWAYMTAYEHSLRQRDLKILHVLTKSMRKATEGDLIQLESFRNQKLTERQFLALIRRKTGSLLSASCQIGALLCQAKSAETSALKSYGYNVGVAFHLAMELTDFRATQERASTAMSSRLREKRLTPPWLCLIAHNPGRLSNIKRSANGGPGLKEVEATLTNLDWRKDLEPLRHITLSYTQRARNALALLPDNLYQHELAGISRSIEQLVQCVFRRL